MPVTNVKVYVTTIFKNARDFLQLAREICGENGREILGLARENIRKYAREKSKVPVTNSQKSVSLALWGFTGKK